MRLQQTLTGLFGPWATDEWAPVLSSSTGALGGTSGSIGAVLRFGKTVLFSGASTITNNGTGGAVLQATLPAPPKSGLLQPISAMRYEAGVDTIQLLSFTSPGTGLLALLLPDGTYPGAANKTFYFNGVYEAA